MMERLFELIRTESNGEDRNPKVIFTGTESECYQKFHNVCSFSYSDHKQISYTHYNVEPVTDYFEYYDKLPKEVQKVLEEDLTDEMDYDNCLDLSVRLKYRDFKMDFGLDGEPFGLMPKYFFEIELKEIVAINYEPYEPIKGVNRMLTSRGKEFIDKYFKEKKYNAEYFDKYGNKYEAQEIKTNS